MKWPTIPAAHKLKSPNELRVKPETWWNAVWQPVEKQQKQGPRGDPAEAKHLEWKSWIDNEVFDLVDLRKVKPKNYVTGRGVLTIKTDKQGNFLGAKARWV